MEIAFSTSYIVFILGHLNHFIRNQARSKLMVSQVTCESDKLSRGMLYMKAPLLKITRLRSLRTDLVRIVEGITEEV